MDYKSPFQSSIDQCIFRNVWIHTAGLNNPRYCIYRKHCRLRVDVDEYTIQRWVDFTHCGGRPTFTLFPLSSCHFCAVPRFKLFCRAQYTSCFYSKHHTFASACSWQTPVTAIVSFYKVNNKGGAWLGKATTNEVSINPPPPSMQTLLACVVMLSLVEDYKTSYFGTVIWVQNAA